MVRLRFKRFGRRNRPFFRLNATDMRSPRDGRVIEELGFYDPIEKDAAKAMKLKSERVSYWLSVGAQPSETVADLLVKAGLYTKPKKKSSAPKKPAPAAGAEAKSDTPPSQA